MAADTKSNVVPTQGKDFSPKTNDMNSKIVMECFGKLGEPCDATREKAVLNLIAKLEAEERRNGQGEEASTLSSYSVEYLVRGLSSPRKAARLGFYVALVQVLRVLPDTFQPSLIMELVEKHLMANSTKQDANNIIIGTILSYGALIRSSRITEDMDLLIRISKDLLKLSSQKPYCEELCATFLIALFSKVKEFVFKKHIWPSLKSHFACGWKSATPDVLWMMLALTSSYKNAVDEKFLVKHWGRKMLLHLNNAGNVIQILMNSTKSHPHVHPVCKEVIVTMLNSADFPVFWKSFVEVVSEKQQKEKLFLLFELLKEIFQHLKDPNRVKSVLLPSVMTHFIKNLAHKEMLLHAAAMDLQKVLTSSVVKSQDGQFQFSILECLLKKPSSIMFDKITRTKTVSLVVSHLKAEAVNDLILLLRNIFSGQSEDETGELVVECEAHRAAALHQLAHASVHQNVLDSKLQTDILQFFALHAFFDQLTSSTKVPQCSKKPVDVTQHLHTVAQECFFKSVCTFPKRIGADSSLLQLHCTMLIDVLQYVHLLLKHPKIITPLKPWSETVHKNFKDILQYLNKLQKQQKNDVASLSKSQAFQVLFLHLGFELFVNAKHASKISQDLKVCYEKSLTKNKTGEKEPKWIEVVVDLLLSLLSKRNQQLRLIVNNVFILVTPHLTIAALQQILDVIDPNSVNDEDPVLGDDDDDDDVETDKEMNNSSDSEDDEEDEEEEEASSETSATLKSSIKAVLGNAAGDSENDDETYLDDEAMMRVDDSLSEVFRSIVKKKQSLSKSEEALLHFRNRCLDLLTIVINTRPSASFLLHSIMPLVAAVELGIREKGQDSLMKKASACLRHITQIKKFHPEDMHRVEPVDILSSIVNKFQSVGDYLLTPLLTKTCTFIVKCALFYDQNPNLSTDQIKTGSSSAGKCLTVFKDSLENVFVKGDSHIPVQMFFILFSKYTELSWELCDILLCSAFDADIRLFKRSQAVAMLSVLTSGHGRIQKIVSKKSWTTFSTIFLQGVVKTINTMMSSELKQKHLSSLLQLTCNVLSISQKMQIGVDDGEAFKSAVVALHDQPKLSQACVTPLRRICALLGTPLISGEKRKKPRKKIVKKRLKTSPDAN